jgi:hypothetical protein
MRLVLLLFAATTLFAQPRIDNVLIRMVPPGSTSLVGVNMERMKATAFYRKLVEQQRMPQVDKFAEETGFDPRRDVRELLYASTPEGSVLLARGRFKLTTYPASQAKLVRYGSYNIWTLENSGFCILDQTLAAAGELKALEAALDEWTRGQHKAAQPLLAMSKGVAPTANLWGVSTGFAGFLASVLPKGGVSGGIDFSRIFTGMKSSWFQADFATGLRLDLRGATATDTDAIALRDMAKGLIGFGRLSVPENQPEMLKLWDGISVDQETRNITIRADITPALLDKLVQMLNSVPAGRGGREVAGRGPGIKL